MTTVSNIMSKAPAVYAALMLGTAVPAFAATNDVVLKSADGSINISGELVEFVDQFYVLKTSLGNLRVSAERVRCEGAGCPTFEAQAADITLAGSDTIGLGLMPLVMEGYASFLDAEPTIVATANEAEVLASFVGDSGYGDELGTYKVSSTGSADAFTALLDGNAELGMSARRITPDEARALKASGAGNMISTSQEHIIAVDGLTVIVHPSNPISQVTMDQLRSIYTGEITNWSQLGGADLPITFVTRAEGSGSRFVFEDRIFDGEVTAASNQIEAADNSALSTLVNDTPGAIGYVGFAFQRGAKPLPLVNECGITTTPDAFSAKTEEYALQRRLYLYNRQDTSDPLVSQFLDYATSEAVDAVVSKAGFVDLGVKKREQGLDSPRATTLQSAGLPAYESQFANAMMDEMVSYDRLSTTFRFRTGSSRLDERGVLDMKRLAKYLQTQPQGTEIVMVGFTDDVGAFDSNLRLSEERARSVLALMQEQHPELAEQVSFETKGFGEVSPVACNVSDNGRAINRRVEVWLKSASNLAG